MSHDVDTAPETPGTTIGSAGDGGDPWRTWRPWWRVIGSLVAVVMLVAGVANVVGMLSERTEQVARTVDATDVRLVQVDIENSELEVVGGVDDQIVVTGAVTSGFRRTQFSVEDIDGVVLVRLECGHGPALNDCGGDLRIEMPRELRISVDAPNSPVQVRDLDGFVDVRSSNSEIDVSGLGGPVRLQSSNGSVQGLQLFSTDVEVRTSNDGVELQFETAPQSVVVATENAGAKVVLPDTDDFYHLQLTTSNATSIAEVRTDPDSDRRVKVTTSNDDIRVTYPA